MNVPARLAFAVLLTGCAGLNPQSQATLEGISGTAIAVGDFEVAVAGSMEKGGVTGLSVAILNDGIITYTRAFGWKDRDAGSQLNDTTVFPAASLSKPVFAYLVLVLAHEGLIDLDRPLIQYLKEPIGDYPRYADLAEDARHRAITARMVLSHTSGLPNLRSEAPDGRLRIQQPPGRGFSYSGEAIQLLQVVVETITGLDLESVAQQRVFGPFQMRHSSFVWREAFAANAAAPHNEFEWAADIYRPVIAYAAGSLTTTAHDYGLFLQGVLANKPIASQMIAPVVRIRSRRMFGRGSSEESEGDEANRLSWGHGVGVFETPHGSAFMHTGNLAGVKNYTVVYPDHGIGIVLISNSDNFESVANEIVAAGIGDAYSPFNWLGYVPFDQVTRRLPPPRRIPTTVSEDVVAPYAGRYEAANGSFVVFVRTEGPRLYVSDDGDSWSEASPESETRFFFKGRDVTLEFQKEAGVVTGLEIHVNGNVIRARRQ